MLSESGLICQSFLLNFCSESLGLLPALCLPLRIFNSVIVRDNPRVFAVFHIHDVGHLRHMLLEVTEPTKEQCNVLANNLLLRRLTVADLRDLLLHKSADARLAYVWY